MDSDRTQTKRIVTINGAEIAYTDAGTSADAVVFVHGHPFNRSMWSPQVEAVVRSGRRAIAPDLRGYGDSQVVPGVTTLNQFADDLAALLEFLRVERVIMAGLSMGGQIVMAFAAQFRSRLRGIVLAATSPSPETADGKQRRFEMVARLEREGMDGYAAEVLDKMIAPANIERLPHVANHVRAMMRATDPRGAAAALRGRAERPDYCPVLKELSIPALIVVGDQDAFTTRADAEQMHALLSRSELVWLNGVGHMPNLESAEEFNRRLEAFVGRTAY
jgi:pimeloyl-ACP methyl ester carboxylesterase